MKFGKTIKLFLIDGDSNGRMTCELSNWSGKAYKIPRIRINECKDREELKSPGVYLLFGKDETGQDLVYIGEAEVVFKRLKQHLNQKDFWNEAIVFISKDENLNKAHIKYLENRLYELALSVHRYQLENSVIPI
ncbi:GIY-YIG nuclease family protein [Rapidithrix thailandica]|uniref:GIY-YIG nuclease family protein n=1 Tax=Rapidithrix thailandica TaxID=413964 RepID=A0AAW9S0Q3_9BACT